MSDKITILKYVLVAFLIVIALFSLTGGNALVGFAAIIAVGIFIYLNYIKPQFQREPIDKRDLIDTLIHSLDYDYKHSVGEDNFELYSDVRYGDEEHKFVFVKKDDDGILWYYPCTIDIYTGKVTSMTGTRTDKISNAEYFITGVRTPPQKPKLDQELINELIANQKEQIRDDVNRALGEDVRDSNERVG